MGRRGTVVSIGWVWGFDFRLCFFGFRRVRREVWRWSFGRDGWVDNEGCCCCCCEDDEREQGPGVVGRVRNMVVVVVVVVLSNKLCFGEY